MAGFSGFKFVQEARPTQLDPVIQRRSKLLSGLEEQAALVAGLISGKEYVPLKEQQVVDEATGEVTVIRKPKQLRTWFWHGENGKLYLALRYGNRILELVKGKTAIEVKDYEQLQDTLEQLRVAVVAGELDTAISQASARVRSNFVK